MTDSLLFLRFRWVNTIHYYVEFVLHVGSDQVDKVLPSVDNTPLG